MGCSLSAISDDMDDWDDFKKLAGIKGVKWGMYSTEAAYATAEFKAYGTTGPSLIKVVELSVEITKARKEHTEKVQREKLYQELKAEFEPRG